MFSLGCSITSWAWLFVGAAAVETGLAVILAQYFGQSRAVRWLQAFLILAIIVNLSAAGIGCVVTPDWYTFFVDLRNIASVLVVPIFVMFGITFINRNDWLKTFWLSSLLVALPFTMIVLMRGDLIFFRDISHATMVAWGYRVSEAGPYTWLYSVYSGVGLITPIILLSWYYHRLQDMQKRREVNIIRAALIVPVVVGIVGELLLPLVTGQPAFPLGTVLSVVSICAVAYAIIRYGLRIFNGDDVISKVTHIMPSGLFVLDHTQTVQYANRAAGELLGYPEQQLIGASIKKLLRSSEARQTFQSVVMEPLTARNKKVVVPDTVLIHRGGYPVPVTINATRVDAGGGSFNTVVVATNIAALKDAQHALATEKLHIEQTVRTRTHELATAQAELLASIRSLPFGFALVNPKGVVTVHNQLFRKFTGHSAEVESQQSVADVLSAEFDEAANVKSVLQRVAKLRQPVQKELSLGPSFFRLQASPVLSANGRVIGTALLVEDITDVKAQERSRNEFFSIASHELRTPLTTIRGNAELILDYFPKAMADPELKQMVTDMEQAGARLIAIVNDFLDASRLEQGRIEYKYDYFDVRQLVLGVFHDFESGGSVHVTKLSLDSAKGNEPKVYADSDRVRQILVNLISNAYKYTPAGSITVHIASRDSKLRITVTDTGKGIPVQSQHLLFRKFQQASNNILTRDNTRSTGLGLYISRLMAQGMRGSLKLERSEIGVGSSFCLELPLAPGRGGVK